MFLIPANTYRIGQTQKKGRGIFAVRAIPAGTVIGDYLGRVISDRAAEILEKKYNDSCYAFEYVGKDVSLFPLDIKATDVHLINHSCSANCEVRDYQGHNLYFSGRYIFPGEELTFDYAFEPYPQGSVSHCFCDSPFCRGTMYARVDKPSLKNKAKSRSQKKVAPDTYPITKLGDILPPLKKYPTVIKDKSTYNIFANLKVRPLYLNGTKLPPLSVLRRQMRLSGRRLRFPDLNLTVLGIVDGYLLTTS